MIVVGSPVWISLLIAAFAIILSLYVSVWSIIISLWAVFVAVIVSSFGGVASGMIFVVTGNAFTGGAAVGVGLICAGTAVFLFFGCKAATKGILLLTERMALSVKKRFVKKENVQ